MSISILDNFGYKGKKPNFSRDLFETVAEMKAFPSNYLPEVFECNVAETGKRYRYIESNTEDETTGKWREVTSGGAVADSYTKAETDTLLDEKLSIEHDALDSGKVCVVGDDGNIELRKLSGEDVTIEIEGNTSAIQDLLNVANGFPVLDANGKILASQLPTSARKIVGYIDAENVHVLPDATLYDAGSELIISSAGSIVQSTAFTLTAGNKLTEMEVSNANALITAGYVFTITDEGTSSSLGTVKTFGNEKLTFVDDSEVTLPYANDLTASSVPSTVPVAVSVGDEFMVIDGHWVHLSNTSNVTSVNGKAGNVVLTSSDINVTINGTSKTLQNALDDNEIGGGSAEKVAYENASYSTWTNVKKAIDGILAKIDYVKPEITSFTSTASSVYEIGQKIASITFNWVTNKDITTQTLTDCTLADETVRTAVYNTELSSNKTFTLNVSDGQNSASKSVSIAFRNKFYYGPAAIPDEFNSAFILGLSGKQFATGKAGKYTMTVGAGEYGFLAFPSSFGTISTVNIGGFDTDVVACGDISFTNVSGGIATYSIYRTGRTGLGTITTEVK